MRFPMSAVAAGLLLLVVVPGAGAQSLTVGSPDGRRTLPAVALKGTVVIDGVLDDEAWQDATPASGFIQSDPVEGVPASEDTEVRVAFDHEAIYIAALCRDSDPAGVVVNEIRKDFSGTEQD